MMFRVVSFFPAMFRNFSYFFRKFSRFFREFSRISTIFAMFFQRFGVGWVGRWTGLGWAGGWVGWGRLGSGRGGGSEEQKEQKDELLVVDSRRLRGRANLESDKHAGKPGAFAIFTKNTHFRWIFTKTLHRRTSVPIRVHAWINCKDELV